MIPVGSEFKIERGNPGDQIKSCAFAAFDNVLAGNRIDTFSALG